MAELESFGKFVELTRNDPTGNSKGRLQANQHLQWMYIDRSAVPRDIRSSSAKSNMQHSKKCICLHSGAYSMFNIKCSFTSLSTGAIRPSGTGYSTVRNTCDTSSRVPRMMTTECIALMLARSCMMLSTGVDGCNTYSLEQVNNRLYY